MTLDTLNRAMAHVVPELDKHGFWTPEVESVEVILEPVFIWYWWAAALYGEGKIWIPRFTFVTERSYRSSLRHEYGHAILDKHQDEIDSIEFGSCFNPEQCCGKAHRCHVSDYAMTHPEEDFCETFAMFIQRKGRLGQNACAVLRRKWGYIKRLSQVLRRQSKR